ncbi:RelA/SpoT domain-containing protein [Undibacterium amnicola]|uniref:RelA/SpoT domain-containing protein n=2 Tax=Undibacterium amnicola TaxID=1834038 RepID=A0ABR6XS40_9BURK|nr:RelA/SpoT domain-containing protein [Undibacterium amnicola]
MASSAYENQKCILKFSKGQIEKAGRSIRHGCTGDDRKDAILKIQNYRETHLYPLMLIKNHLVQATKKVTKQGLVARRLKMLSTIIDKLERPTLDGKKSNAIEVTRMQDIGGCRAIVPNLKQLNELHERLKNSHSVHQIIKTSDYLTPKDSGYGGIHLVYSCFAGTESDNEWKKTKIEVQLRTELQHAWATSLEIIDTLEGIKLKTSLDGHDDWRRFFKISGLLVAHTEKSCLIHEDQLPILILELRELESKLDVRDRLSRFNIAIQFTTDKKQLPKKILAHQGMFLVKILKGSEKNPQQPGKVKIEVTISTFGLSEMDQALEALAVSEADEQVLITVLVSADGVRNLKKAYPNYFGSTRKFQNFISTYVEAHKK